jgi:hypothetical protein
VHFDMMLEQSAHLHLDLRLAGAIVDFLLVGPLHMGRNTSIYLSKVRKQR